MHILCEMKILYDIHIYLEIFKLTDTIYTEYTVCLNKHIYYYINHKIYH